MKVRVWILGALLGVAACGGQDGGGGVASGGGAVASPSKSLSGEEADLKFAQCMREKGVDVPDPKPGADRWDIRAGQDRKKLEGAMKECRHYLEAGGRMPDMKDPKVRDAFTKFAQCMRENGVNMPDPGPDGAFKALDLQGVPKEKAQKARDVCKQHLPGGLGQR